MPTAAQLMVKCLENEGVSVVFGLPGEENIRFIQALAASCDPLHAHPPRTGRGVHGRDVRPRHRAGRRGVGDVGSGCHQHAARASPTPRRTAPRWSQSPLKSAKTANTRSRISTSTWCRCSLPSPDGPTAFPRRARYPRCSARRSRSQKPNARPLSTSPSPSTSTPTRPTTTWRPCHATSSVPRRRRLHRCTARSRSLRNAKRPVVLAGHGAARGDATAALVRFSDDLGVPVANTFHGKGVMPDDHPNSIGTIGFMRRDYVNFGFETPTSIIAVGYELQEFDPVRINPNADKKIIHIHRFPAEVDMHYPVSVGIIGDISESLNAADRSIGRAPLRHRRCCPGLQACSPRNSHAGNKIRDFHSPRNASSPTPAPRSAAATSCSSTPGQRKCGWRGCIRPTNAIPA